MKNNLSILSVLSLGACTILMGGCAAISHPNAMASGYSYHQETYKSPTPPPSPKVTMAQREYMDANQAEQFRSAVYDLLTRISQRAGMPPKPVYVLTPDHMSSFYANIDNDLRESMRALGYALADNPTGAYVFAYDAQTFERPRGYVSKGEANVTLALRVFDSIGRDARLLTEETGAYYIQGAELLNIRPASYHAMPSSRDIIKQAHGFEPASVDPISEPASVSYSQSYSAGGTASYTSEPSAMMTGSSTSPTVAYDAPSQAVEINSAPQFSSYGRTSPYQDY